jgi:hypothetical protein
MDGKTVIYEDVLSDTVKMDAMLKYTEGNRRVPVIVDRGKIEIGFKGKS